MFRATLRSSSGGVHTERSLAENTIPDDVLIQFELLFRATLCSSSGGVHTERSLAENTIPDDVLIQFELLMMSTELLETCRGL